MAEYLVDTDIFIWYLRGNEKARELLHAIDFSISAVTYMELLQGMRDKRELRLLKKMITEWGIGVIPVDEVITSKAIHLMESFSLSHALTMADALIAATALERGLRLATANDKHYRFIDALEIERFRP